MFMVRVIAVGAAVAWSALGASSIPGDARRGEQLFTSEQCIQCHSLNGKGGTLAPDLSRRVDRDYTPSVMASLMWNHAPDMWAAMKRQGIKKGDMTPEKAADLFAYFVSTRYFEKAGDAARGQMGVPCRPRHPRPTDVEPRTENARRILQAKAGMGQDHRAGTHRHAG